MLNLYDVVKVKKDYPEYSLKKEYIGTVVDVINNGEAYTIEFINEQGETIEEALFTEFKESELILKEQK
jgi:hypothetical protein